MTMVATIVWLIRTTAIVYDCNVTGMPMVHCVVSKETGDVARHCIKLVEEAFFPFNLMDFSSRIDCMALPNYNGDYLWLRSVTGLVEAPLFCAIL